MKSGIAGLLLMLTLHFSAYAQDIHQNPLQTWGLLITNFKIADRLHIENEFHERTGAAFHKQGQFIFRPSVQYYVQEKVILSAGYSFLRSWPDKFTGQPIPINESNIWEQVIVNFEAGKVRMQNRFRQENRFIDQVISTAEGYTTSGTSYANRFRYRLTLTRDLINFANEDKLLFMAFDEFWFHQDKYLRPTNFARNWLFLGVGYRPNKVSTLSIGYMNQYDKTATGYSSTPIGQVTYLWNFDLRKNEGAE